MDKLVDKCFDKNNIKTLRGMGLKSPSAVQDNEKNVMHDAAEKLLMKVGGIKGKAIQNNQKEIAEDADHVMTLLKVYQGVMKPKNGRINKINSFGEFGDLVIHLPGLLSNGVMKVFSNGEKVMDEAVDQDTIDLLMKRLDKKRDYSGLSYKILDKLIQLNDAVQEESDDDLEDDPIEEQSNEDMSDNKVETVMSEIQDGDCSIESQKVLLSALSQLFSDDKITINEIINILNNIGN